MLPLTKYLSIGGVLVFVVGVWYYGTKQHEAGYNKAKSEYSDILIEQRNSCDLRVASLSNAISEMNRKEQLMIESQKESYRKALDIRNDQYEVLSSNLSGTQKRLRELINEASEACVNTDIPDRFK